MQEPSFDGNEAIRWDLIWHLYDLTGDGRDDLIAQVPNFSVCAECFLWKVFPAHFETNGSFWTFDAVGIDLNLAVTKDMDSSLADWTGDGLPELIIVDPGRATSSSATLVARVMRRATTGGLAFEFEAQDRTVSYSGFEPGVRFSFGTETRDTVRGGGDLDGDGISDLVLNVRKIRAGFVCVGGMCKACGQALQPVCSLDRECDPANNQCGLLQPDPLGLADAPEWGNASEALPMQSTSTAVNYWLTAKVVQNGNNFVLTAGQCVGPTTGGLCDDAPNLLSASLVDINGDGLADVFMRYLLSGSGNSRIDRFAYRLNKAGILSPTICCLK